MAKTLEWRGIELKLLSSRVLYIPLYHILVVSDWHLGKLGHFRKEGLFVPAMQLQEEFDRFGRIVEQYSVQKVVFLGDLFHSTHNSEWDALMRYLQQFSTIEFILTKGNHDILSGLPLDQSPLMVVDYLELVEGIVLSHEPIPTGHAVLNIVGHIHPGAEIHGRGRQRFRLPCFHLHENVLTLPAFGRWTGLHIIKKRADNRLFPIMANEVIELF